MINRYRSSVGLRLAGLALVFAWVASLLASGYQLWQSRQAEEQRLSQLLSEMIVGSEIQMADIVWEEDGARAQQLADNILRTTDVTFVLVRSTNTILAQGGERAQHLLQRTIPLQLRHGVMAPARFGEFTLGVDMDVIDARLGKNFRMILIRTTILIFLNIAMFLLLFRFMVTRHLSHIGRFFAAMTADTLERPLMLDRAQPPADGGDEFDHLQRGIRQMQSTLANDLKRRQKAEEAVRLVNEELEVTVAERTAELIEKNKQLELLSLTDRLTGIANRLQLDALLEHEFAGCERNQNDLSLIMLDIDNFKRVNDTHGHQVGDLVLIETAQTLRNNIRRFDVIGRWGGEEFLIICTDTREAAAANLAEKLRIALTEHDVPVTGPISASFGVSAYRPGDTVKMLIRRADAALYRAKNTGRNRVELG